MMGWSSGSPHLSLECCSSARPTPPAFSPSLTHRPKKCNCKKSKCLKLYCDCFANGDFCGGSCSCTNCANKMENRRVHSCGRGAGIPLRLL